MPATFGKRVVGAAEASRAIAAEKGGLEVFGKRVRGATGSRADELMGKGNSDFGARVAADASFQNHKGEHGPDSLSVEDIDNMLEENPTFFDSLYEAELARPGGPRKAALKIFAVVEMGIKGAMRASVMEEINSLLGLNQVESKVEAEAYKAHARKIAPRAERMASLEDARRSDADRNDLMGAHLDEAEGDDDDDFDDEEDGEGAEGERFHTDLGPDDTKPETQTQSLRHSQKDGANEGEGEKGEQREQGEMKDYDSMTKDELHAEADALEVDQSAINGSGSNGAVLRDDLLKAVKRAARKKIKDAQA